MMSNLVTVKLSSGVVRGQEVISKLGKKYFAFKGIPYARPPVGNLRFKPPQPLEPWEGVREALKEGNRAPHFDMVTKQFCGDEDCLYLNVYTPMLPEENVGKMAVMFWIHGGGFAFGHADEDVYGPDFLIEKNIVLVTINYRLGVLGFLNLNLEEAAGNMGLKDQVFALKWVKKEIDAFGGDLDNVTIFGESAGGASVHFHVLSRLSRGLFEKAIVQSGTSLNVWAFTTDHLGRAKRLATLLGCTKEDQLSLLEFFRTVPPIEFAKHQDQIRTNVDILKGADQIFLPSVEKEFGNSEAFLTDLPECYLRSGCFNDVPIIIGTTSHEGICALSSAKKYNWHLEYLNSSFNLLLNEKLSNPEKSKMLKEMYFGKEKITCQHPSLVDLYTDAQFQLSVLDVVDFHISNGTKPVYCYKFSFDGSLGWYKPLFIPIKASGPCHADDLGYLFTNTIFGDQNVNSDSLEMKVVDNITTLWSNFAKTGKPFLESSSCSWTSVSKNRYPYLDISERIELKDNLLDQRIQYWRKLNITSSSDY